MLFSRKGRLERTASRSQMFWGRVGATSGLKAGEVGGASAERGSERRAIRASPASRYVRHGNLSTGFALLFSSTTMLFIQKFCMVGQCKVWNGTMARAQTRSSYLTTPIMQNRIASFLPTLCHDCAVSGAGRFAADPTQHGQHNRRSMATVLSQHSYLAHSSFLRACRSALLSGLLPMLRRSPLQSRTILC